jgi:ABC-2 type transport system permease protein
MKKLIRLEWMKISGYRTFWVFLGLYVLLIFSVYYGFDSVLKLGINMSSVYRFPDVWYYVAYVSSWFAPILGLMMINLVANEFTFKTLRQEIIDGLSRSEFLAAKLGFAAIISIGAGLIALIAGLTIGLLKGDQGFTQELFSQLDYILRICWVCFGMMSAGILITLLFKRSALAILIFLALFWIAEPLAGRIWLADIYPYFPLNSLDEFISSPISLESPVPNFGRIPTQTGVLIAGLIWPIVFNLISFQLIRSKDL